MSQPINERTHLRPESRSDLFPLETQGSRVTIAPPGSSPAEARRCGPDKGGQGSFWGRQYLGLPVPTCPRSSTPPLHVLTQPLGCLQSGATPGEA